MDEDLPWRSTISRTRQLYPTAVFERLFDYVFAQCVQQGLVKGNTQAVDSAPVKANASLDSVREKQSPQDVSAGLRVVDSACSPPTIPPPSTVRSAPINYGTGPPGKRNGKRNPAL